MNVEVCQDQNLWDAFVAACPAASNYHRWVWKEVIEETYGHPGYYLVARTDNSIQGALPLFWMKSRLFGRFLISLPFFSYGGVLAQTPEAREALLARAVELARELGARHIELRSVDGEDSDGVWRHFAPKVTMLVHLPNTVDQYSQQLSSKMRQRIRFAAKHGLRCEWGGIEAVDGFYRVFSTNMRNLGTPVYPRRWFENICRYLPGASCLLTIWDGKQPVAAGIVTEFRDGLELPWSGSTPESRQKQAVVYMFWTLIEWAIQRGYRFVDFGRCTRGGGVHRFKELWDCEERPLHWHYWLREGVPLPELRPENPRFRAAVRVWQHLPLGVTNWLGPRIVRSIP